MFSQAILVINSIAIWNHRKNNFTKGLSCHT